MNPTPEQADRDAAKAAFNDCTYLQVCEIFMRHRIAATEAQAAEIARLRNMLTAILDAQRVQPYRGWNLTELNSAVDDARTFMGLPSIRELNPDIAAMQDHAAANRDEIRTALSQHRGK